jgi:predicted dehydrogenase
MKKIEENTKGKGNLNRRAFLSKTGTALASFSILSPALVRGSRNNAKIKIGLIGCGGRGTWITDLFEEHGHYEIAAAADYYQDRVDRFGDKYNVSKKKRFTGLSCYKKLLEKGDVDAIAIESPPYFHPEQAAAAVGAGKHVYVAKPIAVDVPGCKSVEQSAKLATEKGLCFLVDFQTRANDFYKEALRQVHEGALGDLAFGEGIYHAGIPWKNQYESWKMIEENPELRLKAWGLDLALSGDIITEQNIHTIDVMNWIMDTSPIYVVGTGGRSVRPIGDIWDHYTLLYQYPNNVGITFSSRQFNGHGVQIEGIRNRMFGSKGALEAQYGGQVIIRGEHLYKGGRTNDIFKQGAIINISDFYNNIKNSVYDNTTVAPSVKSNLLTIMGRKAAQSGDKVYWYQLLNDKEKLIPDLRGMKD